MWHEQLQLVDKTKKQVQKKDTDQITHRSNRIIFESATFQTSGYIKESHATKTVLSQERVIFFRLRRSPKGELVCLCINDPWDYAVEPLMPDRSKVRRQAKREKGVYAARGRWRSASRTRLLTSCLCKRTSVDATPEEDPTSLKRLSWSQQPRRGSAGS